MITMMLGWPISAAARASWKKRSTCSGSSACSSCSTFTATLRSIKRVLAQVDRAHPAGAELLHRHVAADLGADQIHRAHGTAGAGASAAASRYDRAMSRWAVLALSRSAACSDPSPPGTA
jgi:hypothetical protein